MDARERDLELVRRELEQLQRQNRWLAAFCGLVALALVLSLIVPINTHRARRFELFNDQNRRAAMWRVQDNVAAMILNDNGGRWRAVLSMDHDGPRLELNSALGQPLLSLTTIDSRAALAMRDVEGRERVRIAVDEDGPRMQFFDAQGEAIASYPELDGR